MNTSNFNVRVQATLHIMFCFHMAKEIPLLRIGFFTYVTVLLEMHINVETHFSHSFNVFHSFLAYYVGRPCMLEQIMSHQRSTRGVTFPTNVARKLFLGIDSLLLDACSMHFTDMADEM